MLPKVISRLLCGSHASACVYYAHTLNRFEFLDRDFFDALRTERLRTVTVWPADVADDEAEAEDEVAFSGDLFPEMRRVVLQIYRG